MRLSCFLYLYSAWMGDCALFLLVIPAQAGIQ